MIPSSLITSQVIRATVTRNLRKNMTESSQFTEVSWALYSGSTFSAEIALSYRPDFLVTLKACCVRIIQVKVFTDI